jgi:hypothetical protein
MASVPFRILQGFYHVAALLDLCQWVINLQHTAIFLTAYLLNEVFFFYFYR